MNITLSVLLFVANLVIAPQLYHLERFPHITREQWRVINELNTNRQEYLRKVADLYPMRHDLREMARDLEDRRVAWDVLDNARHCTSLNHRRAELGRLLQIIGSEAFLAGKMPEPY
jgi:hypothetical protein